MLSNTHTHITRMQFHASSATCSIATPLTTKALRQVSRAASSSQKAHPVVLWCMWSGRLRHQRGEGSSRAGESRLGTDGVPLPARCCESADCGQSSKNSGTNGGAGRCAAVSICIIGPPTVTWTMRAYSALTLAPLLLCFPLLKRGEGFEEQVFRSTKSPIFWFCAPMARS